MAAVEKTNMGEQRYILVNREVVQYIKTLDVDGFYNYLTRMNGHNINRSRHVCLAMLHKFRVNKNLRHAFTDGQRRLSKRWLDEHGYSYTLYDEKFARLFGPE